MQTKLNRKEDLFKLLKKTIRTRHLLQTRVADACDAVFSDSRDAHIENTTDSVPVFSTSAARGAQLPK